MKTTFASKLGVHYVGCYFSPENKAKEKGPFEEPYAPPSPVSDCIQAPPHILQKPLVPFLGPFLYLA